MTSLYINNLILSLEDLRNELKQIQDTHSTAAIILLTKFRDGSLSEWLREGNDEEVQIADILDSIDKDYPDSKILDHIICTICDSESSRVCKTDHSKVLKLDRVEFSADNGKTFHIVNTENICLKLDATGYVIKARFIILDAVNEIFQIISSFNGTGQMYGIKKEIRPSNYSKEETIEIECECNRDLIPQSFNYTLQIDDTPIFTAYFETECLCFVAASNNASISLCKYGDPYPVSLEYSFDGSHWSPYEIKTTINLIKTNDYVFLRRMKNDNSGLFSKNDHNYYNFSITGKVSAVGSIMSLLNNRDVESNCFYNLFALCKTLICAPKLPAEKLAIGCYERMFSFCDNLVNAPELPATELRGSCYLEMFWCCTNLVNAPKLPARELKPWCYMSMFEGCTSLVNAPALPATKLAEYCYMSMFEDCTSLVNAPELPATELAECCYMSMFEDCTSLVNAPELPARELYPDCYEGMFDGCQSLQNPPKEIDEES